MKLWSPFFLPAFFVALASASFIVSSIGSSFSLFLTNLLYVSLNCLCCSFSYFNIDLNFHVNFSDKLNNTNYLYGSIFQKDKENSEYALYKDEKSIYKLDEMFEIVGNCWTKKYCW